MAYNPNDCVEVRWGATEGTPESATCKRRAPEDQRPRKGPNIAPGSATPAARLR